MKVLMINGSPRADGNTFTALGEIAKQLNKLGVETELVQLDTEGMQTMRTLAGNMAWMLAKIHANDNPDYPQHESEWQVMNFIR